MANYLVTGGAGFIGSHLVDYLIRKGHKVAIFDNLDPQVHAAGEPEYLNKEAEFILGDVRDETALAKALRGKDAVFHEGAVVGVGQSMYEIKRYVDVNTLGTANLLDVIVNHKLTNIKKLVVASSMSIYGEGKYACDKCGPIYPFDRPVENLLQGKWEMVCPTCGEEARPLPTDESKPLQSTSIYAISKKDQEEMSLCVGKTYDIPTVALRYFNVYGTRQSLSNPYTGVMAIFLSRLLNNNAPLIFEDGLQSRDFVHVSDIVRANVAAMENDNANYQMFNVGTGQAVSVLEITRLLLERLGKNLQPAILGKFRKGDIRHCYADISKIREILGFEPTMSFDNGIDELIEWTKEQSSIDNVERATGELDAKGLIL